jgi:C1A family cysteine protease
MATDKLKSLQANITKKGYDWTAETTSVSELSVADQKALLGLTVNEDELAATASAIAYTEALMDFGAPALPSSVDWRNKGGDWVTPIKDQKSCGSCVSFATLATIESHLRIACKNPTLAIDLSESYEFFCGCGNCCGTGWNFAPALDFAKNTGVALEKDWPYVPNDQPCKQNTPIYTKIKSWSKSLSSNDRKSYLATTGPMVGGFAVYSDFYSYTSGVYKRTPGATLRGYHAISVIGYTDTEQAWICKNSWGTGWGDSGFFKIGYGEADIDKNFAFYGVDVDCPPPPTDPCKKYVPFLRRVLVLARQNRRFRACLCYYVCRRGRRPVCPPNYLRVIKAVLYILRRCPRYRRPFCRALGC